MANEFGTCRRADDRPLRNFAMLALIVTLIVALLCFYAGGVNALRSIEPTVRQVEAKPVPRELPEGVARFHDSANSVTCWVTDSIRHNGDPAYGGISCLPDQLLPGTLAKD